MQLVFLELLKVSVFRLTIKIVYFKIFPLCFSEFSLYIERPSAEGIQDKLESWFIFWWFMTYQVMEKTTELIENPEFYIFEHP